MTKRRRVKTLKPVSKSPELRVFIITRWRSDTMVPHRMSPEATLVVASDEVELYTKYGMEIMSYPKTWEGDSIVRNMLMDKFPDDILLLCDDDMDACVGIVSAPTIKLDHDDMIQLVVNTANEAECIGAKIFGWATMPRPMYCNQLDPVSLSGWVGGIYGVLPQQKNRFDLDIRLRDDADFTLQQLLTSRVVYRDNRFCFTGITDRNLGGLAIYKTEERMEKEQVYLKQKWGKYIKFGERNKVEAVMMNVRRRQSLAIG